MREILNIGEKVLVLAERINKKSVPGKHYKQTVQNISYFNKKTIRNQKRKYKKAYYWLKTQKLINIYSKDSKEMKYFQL